MIKIFFAFCKILFLSLKNLNFNKDELEILKTFNLISIKPKIFICNLNEKEKLEDNKYLNLIKKNYLTSLFIFIKVTLLKK